MTDEPGDRVGGDKVGGDKITVGDISGSSGVAIGREARATVTQGGATPPEDLFQDIYRRLDEMAKPEPQKVEDAKELVREIQQEAEKEEEADESVLARKFRMLAMMGPDILDVVTATLVSPAAGIGMVVKKVAAKAREEAGLSAA